MSTHRRLQRALRPAGTCRRIYSTVIGQARHTQKQ